MTTLAKIANYFFSLALIVVGFLATPKEFIGIALILLAVFVQLDMSLEAIMKVR